MCSLELLVWIAFVFDDDDNDHDHDLDDDASSEKLECNIIFILPVCINKNNSHNLLLNLIDWLIDFWTQLHDINYSYLRQMMYK